MLRKASILVTTLTFLIALLSTGLLVMEKLKNKKLVTSLSVYQQEKVANVDEKIIKIPQRIFIPKLAIDLKVKEATVSGNSWTLYDDAVSYLDTSGKLDQEENAVIYGHNTKNLFGSLKNITIGDRILIETDKGEALSYTVSEKKIVNPETIDIVYPQGDERITIFTCTNFMDADRLVVVAHPTATFGDLLRES